MANELERALETIMQPGFGKTGGETKETPEQYRDALIADIVRDVAELPDRNSPEDQPEMMVVTADELRTILINRLF